MSLAIAVVLGVLDRRGERGASSVEYGLLAAGIAGVVFAAIFLFGGAVSGVFVESCSTIDDSVKLGGC